MAFTAAFISCSDDETKGEVYAVSGNISTANQAIAGVTISIDALQNLTTTTDGNGDFKIDNVPSGNHTLKMKKEFSSPQGNSFSEKNYDLSVDKDTDLLDLTLPNPVFLSITDTSESSISLIWDASVDPDFREYKLYRHTTPGLDESTGELIFVSTTNSITSYVDEDLFANSEYYYRVYVMDDKGKLGGSNLATEKTENVEFIRNGSFEINSTEFWDFYGCPYNEIELDTSMGYNSDNSMQITKVSLEGPCPLYMRQIDQIAQGTITAGQKVELSFYYISEDGPADFWLRIHDNITGFNLISNGESLAQTSTGTWTYYTKEFYVSSEYDNDNVNPKHLDLSPSTVSVVGAKISIDEIRLFGI